MAATAWREKKHRLGSCARFFCSTVTLCVCLLLSFKTCIIFVNVQFIELKPNCCTSIIWVGVGRVVSESAGVCMCVREGCEAPVPGRRAYWRQLNTRTMGSFDQNDTPKTCGLLSPWQPPMGQRAGWQLERRTYKNGVHFFPLKLSRLYIFPLFSGASSTLWPWWMQDTSHFTAPCDWPYRLDLPPTNPPEGKINK